MEDLKGFAQQIVKKRGGKRKEGKNKKNKERKWGRKNHKQQNYFRCHKILKNLENN